MAAGDKVIIPAQAAGFASLFGHIEKGTGDTLNLPEGMLNIGGNTKGYLVNPATDWDPVTNSDGSFTALALGDDVYLYAVQDASGIAQWVASKNSTVPTGYTADNSRKVGGFHYGRYRPASERYNKAFDPGTQILPNSCWDLQHRPKCDPTGMVEIIPGRLWADIYLNSEGSGAWPQTVPESRHGVTPLSGTEGYSRYLDLPVLAANAGKRLPFLNEFYVYADGTPEGNDGDNDTAWSATTNSDRASTGSVAKAVSCLGVVDAAGNLWDPCIDLHDVASESSVDYEWDRPILESGKDSGELRGELYHVRWRFFMAGGHWDIGVRCGSRCAYSNYGPGYVNSHTGLRCVCDSL
ncbi:hypothetical protein L0636_00805 [Halomonas janggokensis]|uniref:Major tropism determinant second domain-containing protein n=1 Tax=Vreelandella janggokensis TaxID=370767 RepID=A0ABT4IRX9_9GAMM|nr:hypothetical protein [Halomonas janggokensis]MCZ0926426.1 hypothetical protein [Halomonas janggokensis]MCZ0928964.1 hypothetical protein [Halomonas janggokensis]